MGDNDDQTTTSTMFDHSLAQLDEALFIKVDVDELEDVMQEAGVVAMPTFQVYKKGALADTVTGASVDKLGAMVAKATA